MPVMPVMPIIPSNPDWYYRDDTGQVQGPFPQDTMRSWHEAGYFHPDLGVKAAHWGTFHAFHAVISDFAVAFLATSPEPGNAVMPRYYTRHRYN
jgi:hypothetical protein